MHYSFIMKFSVVTISILFLANTAFSQSITVEEDGIVRCENVPIGSTETISEITYEVVDRDLLILRRDEGKDLTTVCVSNVTDMSSMFDGKNFNQPIGNWDVSNVTNMRVMFRNKYFNQPIGNWDVSSVSDMSLMFESSIFNQPIGDWDVSNVTDMSTMFRGSTFNQPIGDWNVSSVINMSRLFYDSAFNQPLEDWNVSNVTNMLGVFRSSIFNHPIGDWDVSNVTSMRFMFYDSAFNQPIGNWDVGSVTDMILMFYSSEFNQPIETWDVSNVTDMNSLFRDSQFNQFIGDWDVRNVTNMEWMFANSPFNTPINTWCVTSFITEPAAFSTGSPLTEQNKPIWGTCPDPTSIESDERTSTITLLQNYPNPFNPSTVIGFQLSETSHVQLTIHDALGREVAVLVSQRIAAGSHQIEWMANQMASGMYVYRLTANGTMITGKMMLMK
jgi:surface protein